MLWKRAMECYSFVVVLDGNAYDISTSWIHIWIQVSNSAWLLNNVSWKHEIVNKQTEIDLNCIIFFITG